MLLYLQNESTYSIKLGIFLKLVISSKTSENVIRHSNDKMHTVGVVMTDIWKGETSKRKPEN